MRKNEKKYIFIENQGASDDLGKCLDLYLTQKRPYRELVFLCIGSDRATGDALGPLVGYLLAGVTAENIHVYGNLEKPVHAKNLESVARKIKLTHENAVVIAIDACLGAAGKVGSIVLENDALCPGAGINRPLKLVGDIAIKGIVNSAGTHQIAVAKDEEHVDRSVDFYRSMENIASTRLHTVFQMAEIMVAGIQKSQLIFSKP